MRTCSRICAIILLVFCARAEPASATPITFTLNTVFSGTSLNQSVLSATFGETTLNGTAGVLLTMSMSSDVLYGMEYVQLWGFNLDPTLTPRRPVYVGGSSASVALGSRSFGGGGFYDIWFVFGSFALEGGDQSEWFLPGLVPENFLFLSEVSDPSIGTFYTAAYEGYHRYWVGDRDVDPAPPIPEPITVLLTGGGLVAVSFAVRRRRGRGSR